MLTVLIVVLTLTSSCAQQQYVIFNATIYSMQTTTPERFEAMAVYFGRILELGDSDQLLMKYPTFDSIDAQGLLVLPGFTDAHAHAASEGQLLLGQYVDVRGCDTIECVVDRIKQYIIDHDIMSGEWIRGRGWDHLTLPGQQWPTRYDLDVFRDNPIALTRFDAHAIWANSYAVELSNVQPGEPFGGFIFRDAAGAPTGIFVENGMSAIRAPGSSREDTKAAMVRAFDEFKKFGITGIHSTGGSETDLELLTELIDDGELDLRVYIALTGMIGGVNRGLLERWCTGSNPRPQIHEYGDGRLTMRSVKGMLDGEIGAAGAAFFENYLNETHNGLLRVDIDDYFEVMQEWARCGYQVDTHAIGDRAVRIALNMYERLFIDQPDTRSYRHRIEHNEAPHVDDVPRFAQLGVIPSMQPILSAYKLQFTPQLIGPERERSAFLFRTYIDQGVIVPLGSDLPQLTFDPLEGIYTAVSRLLLDGTPPGGYNPAERVTVYEAVRGFTWNAAYAAHEENKVGSLETGKKADFIVLSHNIMESDFDTLLEAEVLVTVFNGEIVYEADGFELM